MALRPLQRTRYKRDQHAELSYHVGGVSIPAAFGLIRRPIRFSDLKSILFRRNSRLNPTDHKGNPKIGNFPYVDEYITDTTHTVEIPLDNFGDLEAALCNENGDGEIYTNSNMAAHASVLHDSLGQETAWAGEITEKEKGGSWAKEITIRFSCD